MAGPMGSGKTTRALRIAAETGARFLSLDRTIRDFNKPLRDLTDYESLMKEALEVLAPDALQALKGNRSVVFDFGGGMAHWPWLSSLAKKVGAKIEIYHFDVALEERRRRVQKRNVEKPDGVYFFTVSDDEFSQSKTKTDLPPEGDEVTVIRS